MRRGQSALEYSMVIFCVVLALLAMRTYMTRGLQGRLRSEADQLSGQQYDYRTTSGSSSLQYNSHTLTNVVTTTQNNLTTTNANTQIDYDTTSRSGSETIQ